MTNRTMNAGVDNNNGMALQRNTAIFLLLDNYFEKFQNKEYFVCLEHHDDFLFCFLNEKEEADIIEAYQSKKKGSDIWRLNKELCGIITKLLETGNELIKDEIPKSIAYNHLLFFSSNQIINLKVINENVVINDGNELVLFNTLPQSIQNRISSQILNNKLHAELENLKFIYIPFTQVYKEQIIHLEGKIKDVFKDKIFDGNAAIKPLIHLFLEKENVKNQRNKVKLLDQSKRINSSDINDVIKLITTKAKCFNYWHKQEIEIAKILRIRPLEREQFQLDFRTAFDLFKSINEREHKKILNFVKDEISNITTYSNEENVNELFRLFKCSIKTNFTELQLKAILFAALFEVLYLKDN